VRHIRTRLQSESSGAGAGAGVGAAPAAGAPDRGDLTDVEWARLAPLLPPQRSGKAGRPAHDHRRMVNGMLWVDRNGARWSDLPPVYGKWQSVASRFYRWRLAGVWERVRAALEQGASPDEAAAVAPSRGPAAPAERADQASLGHAPEPFAVDAPEGASAGRSAA
jgi:transposase